MERELCPEMLMATVSETPARTHVTDFRATKIVKNPPRVLQILAGPFLSALDAHMRCINVASALPANKLANSGHDA